MASKRGVSEFTHWRRPRSRMYDYNYQYGRSYYKPLVSYIGESQLDAKTRASRRRTVSPPRAATFSERWAADPFYGRYEPYSQYRPTIRAELSRAARASSIPANLDLFPEEQERFGGGRGRSMSRARSVMRESSVFRGQSVARSMTRARSMSRAQSVFNGDDEGRSVRGRSVMTTYYDDYEPLSDEEWERLRKFASKEEREKSIFAMRMSLENPRDLPKKKMMQTTVGHGVYQNSLYGTITWDAEPFVSGRQ